MDWGKFRAKFADGARIGLNEALKKGSLTHIRDGTRRVLKQTTKAAKKYKPKRGLFRFFK